MPIDTVILRGVGSDPGTIGYIVTHGFGALGGAPAAPAVSVGGGHKRHKPVPLHHDPFDHHEELRRAELRKRAAAPAVAKAIVQVAKAIKHVKPGKKVVLPPKVVESIRAVHDQLQAKEFLELTQGELDSQRERAVIERVLLQLEDDDEVMLLTF